MNKLNRFLSVILICIFANIVGAEADLNIVPLTNTMFNEATGTSGSLFYEFEIKNNLPITVAPGLFLSKFALINEKNPYLFALESTTCPFGSTTLYLQPKGVNGDSCIMTFFSPIPNQAGEFYNQFKIFDGLNDTTLSPVFGVKTSNLAIRGKVEVGLPQNALLNQLYGLIFIFENVSRDTEVKNTRITTNIPLKDITENTCNTKGTISPGGSCVIKANYMANKLGPVQKLVTLYYNDSDKTELSVNSNVTNTPIEGVNTIKLPQSISVLSANSLFFNYTNKSKTNAATGVSLSFSQQSGLSVTSNTCSKLKTFQPGTTCNVQLSYSPKTTGAKNIWTKFHYKEGGDIIINSHTFVTPVPIDGRFNLPIAEYVQKNKVYNLSIVFTNKSATQPATNVTIKHYGFTITSNTCNTKLMPSSSCEVKGTFFSKQAGKKDFYAALSYNEGNDVMVSEKTKVANHLYLYIVDEDDKKIKFCLIKNDDTLTNCQIAYSMSKYPDTIGIDEAALNVYVTNVSDSEVLVCKINPVTHKFNDCSDAGYKGGTIRGMFVKPDLNKLYLSNFSAPGNLSICNLISAGKIGNCTQQRISDKVSGILPHGIILSRNEQYVYILSLYTPEAVFMCKLTGAGLVKDCEQQVSAKGKSPAFFTLSLDGTYLYINSEQKRQVYVCKVNKENGTLYACQYDPIDIGPLMGIQISPDNKYVYMATTNADKKITACGIGANGLFTECNSFDTPGITLNRPRSFAIFGN